MHHPLRHFVLAALLLPGCIGPGREPEAQPASRPAEPPAEPGPPAAAGSLLDLERVLQAMRVDLREGEVIRARRRAAGALTVARVPPSDPRAAVLAEIERLDAFAASLCEPAAPGR